MRRLAFVTGLIGLLFLFLATDCPAAERLALLIGNQHYNKKVGELDNPLNDITLVGDALEKVGFKTARLRMRISILLLKQLKHTLLASDRLDLVQSALSTILGTVLRMHQAD